MTPRMLKRIALALGLVLLAWGGLAFWQGRKADASDGLALPRITADSVSQVSLVRDTSRVVLVRAGGGWTVNGYPASAELLGQFFTSMADTALRSELVAQSPASHARLGVDSLTGKRLTVTRNGQAALDLWIGNRGPDFEGFYMRPAGRNEVYVVRGPFAEFTNRGESDWRDHEIATVPSDSVARVEWTIGKQSYRLSHGTGGWSLSNGNPADSIKVRRFLEAFSELRSGDFPSRAQEDSARAAPSDRQVTLFTSAGRPLVTLVLDSMPAGWWVRRAEGGPVFRLDQRMGALLAPAESTFRK